MGTGRGTGCVTPEPADQASQEAAAWGLGGRDAARSHRLPPEEAGGGPAGAWVHPDPLLQGTGDQARCLLASVSVSVTKDTVPPSPGPWEQGRPVGALPHFTCGRLGPRIELMGDIADSQLQV